MDPVTAVTSTPTTAKKSPEGSRTVIRTSRPLPIAVAHLADWSLLTTEFRGSNPVIGNLYSLYLLDRQKERKRRPRMSQLKTQIVHQVAFVIKTLFVSKILNYQFYTKLKLNQKLVNSSYHPWVARWTGTILIDAPWFLIATLVPSWLGNRPWICSQVWL